MRPSPILSLFDSRPPARRGPSAVMVSLLVHGLACIGVYFAVHHPYRLAPAAIPQRYIVRMLEIAPFRPPLPPPVPRPVAKREQPVKSAEEASAPKEAASSASPQEMTEAEPSPAPEALAAARLPKDALSQQHTLQTLIVPDSTKQVVITRPLPQVVLWSNPVQKVNVIVQAPPQTSVAALVASLSPPNQEMHIADLKLAATPLPSLKPLPPASNISPISSPTPAQDQQISMALAKRAGPPTPTDIVVASTIELQSGVTPVPYANAVAPAAETGAIHPGGAKGRSPEGTGVAIVAHNGTGAGTGLTAPGKGTAANAGNGRAVAREGGNGAAAGSHGKGPGTAASAGAGTGGPGFVVHGALVETSDAATDDLAMAPQQRVMTHIVLPKDGQFGMVVIGNTTAEDYPETLNIWRSRLAYSVYLPVGTAQKWILQYALPSSDGTASATGPLRLDAPWPYDISRPSIDNDAQDDAILVHGLLSATGRLERLAVVFPVQLSEASFLLRALNLWQFRPALCNGKPAAVEVLLIIPPVAE